MRLTLVILTFVFSFRPAPGQFVNTLPAVAEGQSPEAAAEIAFAREGLVCLGAWGGEIVFGLDSALVNDHDYGFTVFGNAFENAAEPGIVYVAADENGNGLPDDPWYELAGSESSATRRNISVTYYRPSSDSADIRYLCSDGTTGYIHRNSYHTQPYYPSWISADSMLFRGSMLPCNAHDISGDGTRFELQNYEWGYVDNQPNSDVEANSFKIDWAVDSLGAPVSLDHINFVKVQTGVLFTEGGQIGEMSTEVSGFSLYTRTPDSLDALSAAELVVIGNEVIFASPSLSPCRVYSVSGALVTTIPAGTTVFSLSSLPSGIYLIRTSVNLYKLTLR